MTLTGATISGGIGSDAAVFDDADDNVRGFPPPSSSSIVVIIVTSSGVADHAQNQKSHMETVAMMMRTLPILALSFDSRPVSQDVKTSPRSMTPMMR